MNNMLSFFWCFLAATGIFLHCEWVPSAHNLADGISRHSLDEAKQDGWTLINLQLKSLYSILQRCATDTTFSATDAVPQALRWSHSFKLSDLVLDGETELEKGMNMTSSGWTAQHDEVRSTHLDLEEKDARAWQSDDAPALDHLKRQSEKEV